MRRQLVLWSLVSALALGSAVQAANIIWVSDNKGFGSVEPNVAADQGWIDLLTAQGHNVIYKNQHEYVDGQQYWRTLDPNKIAELEAADLVILGRNADSGSYSTAADNEPNQWNAVTTPLLSLSAHMSRVGGKWGWLNGTGTLRAKETKMRVLDPNHPVFAGVAIDPNGDVAATSGQYNMDWVKDVTDAGNGKILAQRPSDGLICIATWEAGQKFFETGPKVAGGPRMLFVAGTGSGNNAPAYSPDGAYNLTAAGEKMFINAVNFMLPPAPLADDFVDNFDTAGVYSPDHLGVYDGIIGSFDVLDANTSRPGALFMQTTGAAWDPGPGPMLYVNVTGDFVATVKVVDFAGVAGAKVEHNDSGIVARDPAGKEGAENWVAMNYFPTWTGFVARTTVNSARTELGQPTGDWTGANTFALAAQYPYIQLERKGADFFFRVSQDGVNFIPLANPAFAGIYDPNNANLAPLVVNRPDLPATLQVGLMSATYNVTTGYVAYEDFRIVLPRTEIAVGSTADTWMVKDDPNAHGALDYMVVHGGNSDRTGYVRFDLSGLNVQSIKGATLTLFVHGSIPKPPYRNDSCVTGRFALYGLNNIPGNTAQDWDEAVLTSAATGAEMDWATGAVVTTGGQAVDLDDGVAGITETVAPTASPGNASLGATVTITGDALVSFLQSRVDDNGLVTFILKNDDSADRGYGLCTKEFVDEAYRPKLALTAIVKP